MDSPPTSDNEYLAKPESVSKPKRLRQDGQPDRRGTNPKALANLRPPWKPGEAPKSPGGYNVTGCLKDMLNENSGGQKPYARAVAEKIMQASLRPDSRGYTTALTHLLERTEGKVAGDAPANANIQVVIVSSIPRPHYQVAPAVPSAQSMQSLPEPTPIIELEAQNEAK